MRTGLVVVLAVAGTWLSDALLSLHDRAAMHGQAGESLVLRWCSAVSEGGGCEKYAASPWSELHLPFLHLAVPVALLGWIYFAEIGLWYVTGGPLAGAPRWRRWTMIGVGVTGLYGSLLFTCIMAFSPEPWCVACLATHLINVLLLAAIASDVFTRSVQPTATAIRWSPAVSVGFLIVLVALLNRGRTATKAAQSLAIDLKPYEQMVDDARKHADLLIAYYLTQPRVDIPSPSPETPLARHRLVVFTDLQCPACAANAVEINQKIKPLFGSSLTVEIRQFPLCTACNPFASSNVHPDACKAALAAEAARQISGQSIFEAMVSALHEHYFELSPAIYDAEARGLHLPLDAFHSAMTGLPARASVHEDIELGHALGVVSTPTLFLDDRRVPDMCMTDEFWRAIAATPATLPATTLHAPSPAALPAPSHATLPVPSATNR